MQRSLSVISRNIMSMSHLRTFSISCQQNAAAPSDPIQKLFVDKVREYSQKSKSAKHGLVGATPEVEKEFSEALDRVDNQFHAKGVDMTQFPTFNFTEPQLSSPDSGVPMTGDNKVQINEEKEVNNPHGLRPDFMRQSI